MVIRRIREHVAAQNWFAVGIDLAIVVVGVLIATQANNWNEARLERDRAEAYRAQLVEDLRANERMMQDKQAYYQAVLDHATAALEAFDKPAPQLGEAFLVDASQATQISSARAKRFTYDALIAAGDLELLGKLGDRIGDYYVALDNTAYLTSQYPPYRERFRREIPYDVELPIRQHCSDITRQDRRGYFHSSLPSTCTLGLDKALVARGVARLRMAPELDRDLSRYVFFLRQVIGFLKGGEERARELRQIIERSEI